MADLPRAFKLDEDLIVLEVPLPDFTGAGLTKAELEVVRLVADGHSSQAIADQRGVSVRTIANQLAAAYKKLGIQQRSELGAYKGLHDRSSKEGGKR